MMVKIITADNLAALETAINGFTPPEGKVAGTPIQLAGGPWAVMIPLTDDTSGGDDNSGGGDDNSGGGDDNSGGGDDNSGGGDDNSGGAG